MLSFLCNSSPFSSQHLLCPTQCLCCTSSQTIGRSLSCTWLVPRLLAQPFLLFLRASFLDLGSGTAYFHFPLFPCCSLKSQPPSLFPNQWSPSSSSQPLRPDSFRLYPDLTDHWQLSFSVAQFCNLINLAVGLFWLFLSHIQIKPFPPPLAPTGQNKSTSRTPLV